MFFDCQLNIRKFMSVYHDYKIFDLRVKGTDNSDKHVYTQFTSSVVGLLELYIIM